jgi:fructuronate reductase
MQPNIIHMGLGAFHKAHQAVYVQRAINNGAKLAIAGVSQRDSQASDELAAANFRYIVRESSASGDFDFGITAITQAYFYPRDYEKLAEIVAQPDFLAITIAATEKAYVLSDDVQLTLPGRLAHLLHARYLKTKIGIVVISCDNLSSNGRITRNLVIKSSEKMGDIKFTEWIAEQIRFPNSMVDRIVPASKERGIIVTEPFIQWVIEHDPIESVLAGVGIEFVPTVAEYELMKLRLFNSIHSALAYLGELVQIESIAQMISDPAYEKFVAAIQAEAGRSFIAPAGQSAADYSLGIRRRIANPKLGHQCQQIAMDGSQKIPFRIFAIINDLVAAKEPVKFLTLVLALWVEYLRINERINDPLREKLVTLSQTQDSLVGVGLIFKLPDFAVVLNPACFSEIAQWLMQLREFGPEQVIKNLLL